MLGGMLHRFEFQDHSAPVLGTSHLWRLPGANWTDNISVPPPLLSLWERKGKRPIKLLYNLGGGAEKEQRE